MARSIHCQGDLNVEMKRIFDTILEEPLSIDKADFEYRYISDMAHGLLPAESLLNRVL